MAASPFILDQSQFAVPIHALRISEWRPWIESRADAMKRLADAHDFRGQAGRILIVPGTDGGIERVLFGLGEKTSPMLIGALAQHLPQGDYRIAAAPREFPATIVAIAWGLGAYAFERYKPRKRAAPRLVMPEGADAAEAQRLVDAAWLARDLVNTPAGDMGPEALHAEAERIAKAHDAGFEAIVGDALLKENFPMIHAVGRAAAQAPRLLRITWGLSDAPIVALVGKGVTFDTGGLNLKTEGSMRLMKKDMGGAAHALALGQMIMQSGLPVRLEIFLPVVENAVSGDAFRPGDVLKSRKGLTVEVDNTDAEGRLILADALARACELNPLLIMDFATLTGAARVALGPEIPPFFTDDETLAADLAQASQDAWDPIWRLPLWDNYDPDMDSPIADLKNTGDGGFAGAIFGALFLRRFVDAKAWAHFDVFAWSPKERPAKPAGGEAQAIRAAWRVIRQRFPPLG
ncbi:MAG: leucyl aminopeptidase family protein [Alphaproteobacteria bacterium]|nr:leucyl aminopeptidase family protein [Alphaproteobacteria bacterium]